MQHDVRIRLAVLGTVCALTALSACGGSKAPSSSGPSPQSITGRERLGWDQRAADWAELAWIQYALYVDGARVVLAGAACDPTPRATGFACSAPLPALTPGTHVLELASFVVSGGNVLESPKATALQVNVTSTAGQAPGGVAAASDVRAGPVTTEDGVVLDVDLVLTHLTEPVDLAQQADGRWFVAERAGRVVVFDPPTGRVDVALELEGLDTRDGGGLLSMALHPAFDRSRFVYLVYTVPGRDGARTFELARFREAGGRLAERAVLLDGVPASSSSPSAVVRFGPDLQLHVAFDAGGDSERVEDLASYNGKILRMTDAGGLPPDSRRATPVHAIHLGVPSGFDWQPATGTLWVVGRGPAQRDELVAIEADGSIGDDRWLLSRGLQPGVTGATFYRGREFPEFHGDLFAAAADGGHLLRLRFEGDRARRLSSSERLFPGSFGRVLQVVVGVDGTLYFTTGNAAVTGAGTDVLARVKRAS